MLLRPRRPAALRSLLLPRLNNPTRLTLTPPTPTNTAAARFNMSTTTASTTKMKYAFLQELGLSAREPGVCDGHGWFASGPVRQQVNPATGEVIGEVGAWRAWVGGCSVS